MHNDFKVGQDIHVRFSGLVQCPNCGTEAVSAVKSWPVAFMKPGEGVPKQQLYIGIFECPKCKSKFRSRVESAVEFAGTINAVGLAERIGSIRDGLAQTLKTLRLKIRTLEIERSSLLTEVEELKRVAELRASALETEVNQLREEIGALKEVLGSKIIEPS